VHSTTHWPLEVGQRGDRWVVKHRGCLLLSIVEEGPVACDLYERRRSSLGLNCLRVRAHNISLSVGGLQEQEVINSVIFDC